MKDVLIRNGITAEASTTMLAPDLRTAAQSGNSTIVGVRAHIGYHFIIVDSYKEIGGIGYYMIRDPARGAYGVAAKIVESKMSGNGVLLK